MTYTSNSSGGNRRFLRMACVFITALLFCGTWSCKKERVVLSSNKYITLFTFSIPGNPSALVQSSIGGDTIKIGITPGTALTNLVPTVNYVGQSISPASTASENFTSPVKYTVTAQDGSTKTYVVVVHYLSSDKSITSFIFKASENPGVLTKDVVGTIRNDSIAAIVPPGTDLSKLVPDITYNSHNMAPANKTAQDFNGAIGYTLTAADQSSVTYKVFTGSPGTVYFGDQAGYLYALDCITGQVKWKYLTGGAIYHTPAVYKNMIIVGSGDSYAYAVDTARGTLVWKGFLGAGADGETPNVADGIVYFSGAALQALDANTGKGIWEVSLQKNVSVTVNGGTLYEMGGDWCYCLLTLDPQTGDQLPRNGGTYLGDSNPAVANNIVYVQGNEHLMEAFKAGTLDNLWSFGLPGGALGIPVASDPTVSNGVVYFCGYDASGNDGIYALDAITGAQKWYFPGVYQRAPLVQNGLIWVTNANHNAVAVLDSQTGHQKFGFGILGISTFDPLMGNNSVYQSDGHNNFYAYDPFHGALKWQFATAGAVSGAPLAIDGSGNITRPGSSGEQN